MKSLDRNEEFWKGLWGSSRTGELMVFLISGLKYDESKKWGYRIWEHYSGTLMAVLRDFEV